MLLILSVVGDMPVNSEVPVVTSLISRISQLSLSEVHIRVELHVCIHRVTRCACECVCTVFRKKKEFLRASCLLVKVLS